MTVLLLVSALLSAPAAAAPEPAVARPLVLSTLPFDEKSDQVAIFSALRDGLSHTLGQPVQFLPSSSYQDVIEGLQKGRIDVAFVGAAAYARARQGGRVHVILRSVRRGSGSYHGVIVAPMKSAIVSLKDLKGKKVVFVDKDSTSGYLYPRMLLKQAGLNLDTDFVTLFAGSHSQVVEWVLSGKADAGACFAEAPDAEATRALKTLARTDDVLGDPVVVRADLPASLVKQLRAALIGLTQTDESRPFFTAANIDTLVPANDHDYDALVALAAGSH